MTEQLPKLPRWVTPQEPAAAPMRFTLSDLLTLVACGAAGLAISRWVSPYAYRGMRTMDAEWVLYYGLLPLVLGMLNLGQLALLALHVAQRRRSGELSPCEFPGVVVTCSLALMLTFSVLAPNERGAGLLMIFCVTIAFALAFCFATVSTLRRLWDNERLNWTESLGAAAAILPGGVISYSIVTSFPIC
jgi:NO-binding membrane sensor protein with MHYT domain